VTVAVLHVVEAVEGGVARHMVNLVRHVDAKHWVVAPAERGWGTTDTAALEAMEQAGARVELLDMRRSASHPRTFAAVQRVHLLICRTRPDIVHGHSSIGGAIARLAAVGTRARRVYTPHGLFPTRAAYAAERALGQLTDRFIAASPSEARLAQRQRLVPPDRMFVIPNGLDLELPRSAPVDLRSRLGLDPKAPVVGTVGRLAPQKAPEVFVRACARVAAVVPQAAFALVGNGPLANQVHSEIKAAGIQDRFLLLRDRPDGEAFMNQFDVFALSSRYEAGAAYAVMEAMRAEVPVVVTDVVGNRDAVEHGRSGFVVAPDDPKALADSVIRLLDSASLRRRLGEAGRARVAARYELRQVAGSITGLYRSLTAGAR
jgi:glycosyltransferase involved in cell wall biosynthesis